MANFPVTVNRGVESGYVRIIDGLSAFEFPATVNRGVETGYVTVLGGPVVTALFPLSPPCHVAGTNFGFRVSTLLPRTVDLTTLVVSVNVNFVGAVVAYDGGAGGFQAGYTGSVTGAATALEDIYDVVVNPDIDFPDDAFVQVTVAVSDDLGTALSPPESWLFCILPAVPTPSALSFVPDTGVRSGGTTFIVAGTEVDMSSCEDDFDNGVLAPLWGDVSTGSGSAVESATLGRVVLDTGVTAGSVAGFRSVATEGDVDATLVFELRDFTLVEDCVLAELALRVDATTRFVAQAYVVGGIRRFRVDVTEGGTLQFGAPFSGVVLPLAGGANVTIRLLRVGKTVVLFRNGVRLFSWGWVSDAATHEALVRNAVAGSRVVARVGGYVRRPVINFGGVPALDVTTPFAGRAVGTTPRVGCDVRTVDVGVVGCGGASATIASGFTYTLEPELISLRDSPTKRLVVCNDTTLTKRGAS